jgi:transcriptional regulator with XRE-family HTH domain
MYTSALGIRRLRNKFGLSRTELAGKIGISTQQLQRYEHGLNRVSAAALFDLCELFDVSLASMFKRKLKS